MRFTVTDEWPTLKGRLVYHTDEYAFDFEPESIKEVERRTGGQGTTSILIGTLQIEVGIATGMALFVWGYHPHLAWNQNHLPSLRVVPGGVKVSTGGHLQKGVSVPIFNVGEWQTTHDPDTGWICVGDYTASERCSSIEFATNTIAVIEGNLLRAIWLRPTSFE